VFIFTLHGSDDTPGQQRTGSRYVLQLQSVIVIPCCGMYFFTYLEIYSIKDNESYHQNYYKNNLIRYKDYRWGCGRDTRLKEIWGDKATHRTRSHFSRKM